MRERDDASSVQRAKEYAQVIQEVEHVFGLRLPEPVPDWECNNAMRKLFPEEADTSVGRIQARIFVQGHLRGTLERDEEMDRPEPMTPATVRQRHEEYLQFLQVIYRNPAAPQATFTLTNVLGAVKREYAKMLFLRDQEGLAAEERREYAGQVRTYQTMQALVSLAILREVPKKK